MPELHDELIAVDGLIIAPRCSPTCAAAASSRANAPARSRTALIDHSEFRPVQARFRAHPDVILQVRTTEDIQRAKREGKTGIVLGFQNVSAFEDAELIAQRPGPAVVASTSGAASLLGAISGPPIARRIDTSLFPSELRLRSRLRLRWSQAQVRVASRRISIGTA